LKTADRPPALLLAAHGESGGENAQVWRLARALPAFTDLPEIGVGFIKGSPSVGEAMRGLKAERVLVYPLFAAQGYFTRDRLVRLLEEAQASDGNRNVHMLPPLGLDPGLPALIAERATAVVRDLGSTPAEFALMLIAHGSRRNQASREATQELARNIGALNVFRAIGTAFLEQAPFIGEAFAAMPGPVVAVGLFSGEGLHGAGDVPRLLAELGRDDVTLAGNIGSFPELERLIANAVARAVPETISASAAIPGSVLLFPSQS
jgi:sirohydrochlorin ferrochelatase